MAEYDPKLIPSVWRKHLYDPVPTPESTTPAMTLRLTQILWMLEPVQPDLSAEAMTALGAEVSPQPAGDFHGPGGQC